MLINRPDGLSLQLAQASFGTVRSTDYKGECAACNSIVLPTALKVYQKNYVALRGFFSAAAPAEFVCTVIMSPDCTVTMRVDGDGLFQTS
ncbi:MAG: hypothetical protein E7494_11205 [Ruminococcus albus]|nr:hypothetical protein [Ruminococcus albus]